MTTHLERAFELKVPPRQVMDAMRDPALIEKSERSRDALDVRVEDQERTDERHTYVVRTKTHARTVTGIDKSKSEDNATTVSWNLGDERARWSWEGAHGKKVTVEGTYGLVVAGEGSRLTLKASIDVRIPLVGRVVEGKIRDGFEKAWPAYVRLVEAHATQKP